MPMYEFQCSVCGWRQEKLCKMNETGENIICPHCGAKGLERLISSFACPGVKSGQGGCSGCTGGNCANCR